LRVLREGGFRITMPRVQVIRALADTDRALSAYAVHEKILEVGGKIDVVSVYRILATLQEVGLIHHIGLVDGYFPCLLPKAHENVSQIVVFEETGTVRELSLPDALVTLLREQASREGFLPKTIKVEIAA
jgi:Fe2+ or Zn2+ uptake regulation protein